MRFRNSLRLLIGNFKNTYKIVLYNAIILLMTSALFAALIYPSLSVILNSDQMRNVINDIKDFFFAIANGDNPYLMEFKQHFTGEEGTLSQFFILLKNQLPRIIWSVVGCILIYLIERFLTTLCYFTIGDILNDKMQTYATTAFGDSYLKGLGRASVYSIVYVPIIFLVDMATVATCYFLFFYLLGFLGLLVSLFFSTTFIVLIQALKLTLTNMWLPAMVADKQSIGRAMSMKDKTTHAQRRKIFLTYVSTVYFVIIINAASALCTFGSALLLTVPASYFLFICMQFVNYYTVKGRNYFITYESIAVAPTSGRDFFTGMEKAKAELIEQENLKTEEENIKDHPRTSSLSKKNPTEESIDLDEKNGEAKEKEEKTTEKNIEEKK